VPRLTSPEAWTASGDGTTRKGANAVSHFATFPPIPPPGEIEGAVKCFPRCRFLGITREVNHKTSTQHENWISLCEDIASARNESPSISGDSVTGTEIWSKATGFSADHAADQLKLSRELYDYKLSSMFKLLGIEAMESKTEGEVKEVIDGKFGDILAEVGGWQGWETRSREEQERLLERLIDEVQIHFGELAFSELPEWLQRIRSLWHWSGCCMHKDLNTFKGGAVALGTFWNREGLEGPVKLLSRGKEEREELMGTDATDCGSNRSSGGAAKLADLVGALLRNKDEDKGCPEEFQAYCEDNFEGEITSFPDTSNTRYQCYGDAATEIICHSDLYIGFLDQHGKAKKRGAGLNHMEKNILKGLLDPATWTELSVFAVYSEAISKPYALTVRGLYNESKNALDMGEAHQKIITHIDILIGNPDLLIGSDTSYKTGALYGSPWNQAIIDYIHSIRDELPHLQEALVAFLHGARGKWVVFTAEFAPGSKISNSTMEERLLSFRSPTNDHSEGAGAQWKGMSRSCPSMTTHQKDARLFMQLNHPDVETYCHNLPEPDRAFARAKAREIDASKLAGKERETQAKADRKAAEEEEEEAERLRNFREVKDAKECEMIEEFQPILCLETFLALPDSQPSNDFLKRQLIWHRRIGSDDTLPSGTFSNTNKASMKNLVAEALTRLQGKTTDTGTADTELGTVEKDDRSCKSRPQSALTTNGQSGITPHHDGPSTLPGGRILLPMAFGCKWDPVDYSCSYDCIFTAFTWIYLHATSAWKNKWTEESAIANLLSHHFEKVSFGLLGPTPDLTIPTLFAEGRDAWRDVLSEYSPTEFPRRGHKYASVTKVLEVLAEARNPSHFVTIILSCGTTGCRVRMKNMGAKYYMLTPTDWNTSTRTAVPPEHESLETWIKSHYSSPRLTHTADRCGRCQQQLSRKLVFWEPTWIWLEVFPHCAHAVIPALQISLGSATLRLAAVIYCGNNHYRARLHDPSGTWWFYDGQVNRGRPTPDPLISNWRDLFHCGSDFSVTALVYCLED